MIMAIILNNAINGITEIATATYLALRVCQCAGLHQLLNLDLV